MKKWIKIIVALSAFAACLSAILIKLHLDKKKKEELDEFLLPEEDTVVMDVPLKSAPEQPEDSDFLA
ncbi:hypothetical protein [uncultured Faecalicoccus sp.]|uniref:hypothetical protein n=1 Tax=uncultured Faecalicoccus sp. TaxID=1971760 RepID=UPI0025CCB0C7|nr:hypothetical protein [uncultured Faecalicoccus sp.]